MSTFVGNWLSLRICLVTLQAWLSELSGVFRLCGCAECVLGSSQAAVPSAAVWPQGPSQDTPVSKGLLNAACDQEHTELPSYILPSLCGERPHVGIIANGGLELKSTIFSCHVILSSGFTRLVPQFPSWGSSFYPHSHSGLTPMTRFSCPGAQGTG